MLQCLKKPVKWHCNPLAHRACLSVELNMHCGRQFPSLFVVHMPSCLHVLLRVTRPLCSLGRHLGYVPRGCEDSVAHRRLLIKEGRGVHTQHTGQHGNVGPIELIPWSWPGGSQGAPTSRAVLGQQARFWPGVHGALVEGHTETHPWPSRASTKGERPSLRTPVWPYRLNRETW